MKYRFKDLQPQIADSAYIAPDAVIIGDAIIKEGASIWFKTVIRADINSIEVGQQSNIQDTCILHVTREFAVVVGDRVDTDGRLAHELGFEFALVLSGVTGEVPSAADVPVHAVATDLASLVAGDLLGGSLRALGPGTPGAPGAV